MAHIKIQRSVTKTRKIQFGITIRAFRGNVAEQETSALSCYSCSFYPSGHALFWEPTYRAKLTRETKTEPTMCSFLLGTPSDITSLSLQVLASSRWLGGPLGCFPIYPPNPRGSNPNPNQSTPRSKELPETGTYKNEGLHLGYVISFLNISFTMYTITHLPLYPHSSICLRSLEK